MNKTLAVVFIAILIIFLVTTTVVFYRKDKVQIRKSMVPASQCQVQNCHGLEVSCGPKAAQICTEIYMEGDSCRKFIDCQVVNNQCAAVKQNAFFVCKTCLEKCHREFDGKDPALFFGCEKKCGEE